MFLPSVDILYICDCSTFNLTPTHVFWQATSKFILKNRTVLLALVVVLTGFMGYQASKVRLSYELAKILPVSDTNFQLYEAFKARYGEDGNVLVMGVATDKMFQKELFSDWYELNQAIKKIEGVKEVVSNANLREIVRPAST